MAPEQPTDKGSTELGRFLRARRSQVTPADVGFGPGTGVRRTLGLRREEVAALVGVSIDYYTRLERGKETRPSPSVTDALARALKLDPDEHEHLRARLRALAGTDPDAPGLAALIGELLLKSPEFARLWERYDVTRRTAAQKKTFHHPAVSTLTLGF
jgi:transcriptional regulator with XRE-family HTH domain